MYTPIPRNLTPMAGSCIAGNLREISRGKENMTSDDKTTHLVKWSVNISRGWNPLYYFSGERVADSVPPYMVEASAEFDNENAALEFEQKVMKILEGM